MIEITKYKNVLDKGLLLDHYSVLCSIRDGKELPKSKRIQGFMNLLHKKNYLREGVLTPLATELIEFDVLMNDIISTDVLSNEPIKVVQTTGLWISHLHGKIQNILKEKTGKIQARGAINGISYAFLPNLTDFSKTLLRAIIAYKLKDFNKIEVCLINFLYRKIKEDKWFPIMAYYIMKNGMSTMVTDMESMKEDEKIIDEDSSVNI